MKASRYIMKEVTKKYMMKELGTQSLVNIQLKINLLFSFGEGIVVIHAQEINPEETEEALRKSTELDHPIMNQTVDIKETQDEEKEVQEVVHQQETSQQEELFSSSELSQKEEPQGKQALCTQQSDRMNLKLAAKEYQV